MHDHAQALGRDARASELFSHVCRYSVPLCSVLLGMGSCVVVSDHIVVFRVRRS